MRKKSTRFLSAALAVCMMLSALPMGVVSAFADDGIDLTKGTPIENPEDGQTVITIDTPGVYQMYKAYDMPILVTAKGDVTVNITADIDYKGSVGASDNKYYNYVFRASNPEGMLTINAENHEVDAWGNLRGFIYVHNGGKATINGGTYKSDDKETLFNFYGELWLNDVKAYSAETVNNYGGKTYVDGGVYDGGDENETSFWPPFLNKNGAELTLKNAKIHAAKGACIGNNANSTVKIENTTLEYDSDYAAIPNRGNLYFYSGTISAPNASAILNGTEKAYTEVSGGTIEKSKIGIKISAGKVVLGGGSFDGNGNDIYLRNDQYITIKDAFTDTATVKCENAVSDRRITTEDSDEHQKSLKLTSLDDASNGKKYLIGWKQEGGQEYRYLTEQTGYTVTAEHATATRNGETLYSYDQVDEGDDVTLTADAPEDGWVFAGWQVTEGGLTLDNTADTVTFQMPTSDVVVSAQYEYVGTPDVTDDGSGDIVAGVVIGGIAVVGAYEVGTGLYRITQMDDVAMPTNRLALAKLLWERAGKPEPESTVLYSDISAEDTDAQKAARWAVEQELLKDDTNEDEQKFHPAFPVSKLRVCLTWEKAKQKGLFDTAAE